MGIVYEKNGDVVEITIRDVTMSKIGSWKFNANDKKLGAGILKHIQEKYGFYPEVNPVEKKKVSFLDVDVRL